MTVEKKAVFQNLRDPLLKADNNDPLLPFQYSIVNYDGREKSSISESERPSLVNLKNLGYNILKSLDDETVKDINFLELDSYSKCGNDILMSPFKAFLYLTVTSQSAGISSLSNLMGTFTLSLPAIQIGEIKTNITEIDDIETNDDEIRLIKKLKMPSSANTDTQSPIANPENLTELYEVIITTKDKNRDTNRVVITKYYLFEKEIEKFLTDSKAVIENIRFRDC
ncbi:hypothetical protein C1645_835631 [Glomus cerebriforme]|uniref:Uncharacterized protein n=1 Tax=Glomus cerebriforme TaxID=658196 RepID=A0A397SE21_9GLOM|nr:hypothetical protein C1645_835631 [Glomus cerebriforme]